MISKSLLIGTAVLIGQLTLGLPKSVGGEIWVSLNGSDSNPGTAESPLRTPALALRKSRELRRLKKPAIEDGVEIVLTAGTYFLDEPLRIRPEDSGTNEQPTLFRSAEGEQAVLSGGVRIEAWQKLGGPVEGLPAKASGEVWVAKVPEFQGRPLMCRQLWVNGHKAIRARTPNQGTMARLTRWDREQELAGIPKQFGGPFSDSSQLEMTILQQWEIAMLRIKSLQNEGNDCLIRFHEPEGHLEFEHPWPQPVMEPNGAPFFLSGATEFLDQPGEFHCDSKAGLIYYWPLVSQDMADAEAIVPALETLVEVAGTVDRPVTNVAFQNLSFQHTAFDRPAHKGHVPLQAGMYLLEAYKLRPKGTPEWRSLDNQAWIGRPPAAVEVRGTQHTSFQRCHFEHLASTGLDCVTSTTSDVVAGCLFHDIGGNGIQIGSFQDNGIETHLPYNPKDEREICSGAHITNNFVVDCANEDWGCVGICLGFVRDCVVEHNEVTNLSYTGISLGWGWTRDKNAMRNNLVAANHIHRIATRMADTSAVYTLSAQPGTVITRNYVHDIRMSPYVHDPEHWFYLYLDEGSSFITVKDNWCTAEKFLANANGPDNIWDNNGPQVSASVQAEAGLQPAFRDLLELVNPKD